GKLAGVFASSVVRLLRRWHLRWVPFSRAILAVIYPSGASLTVSACPSFTNSTSESTNAFNSRLGSFRPISMFKTYTTEPWLKLMFITSITVRRLIKRVYQSFQVLGFGESFKDG